MVKGKTLTYTIEMARYNQIIGQFLLGNGQPASHQYVTFRLNKNDYTLDADFQTLPITARLDQDGFLPQTKLVNNQTISAPFLLWCNADGYEDKPSKWRVDAPDHSHFHFTNAYNNGIPLDINLARATGIVPKDKTTIQQIVSEAVEATTVDAVIDALQNEFDPLPNYILKSDYIRGDIPTTQNRVTFQTTADFIPETVEVFVNGLLQKKTGDYTTSGGNTIILADQLAIGETITVNYLRG